MKRLLKNWFLERRIRQVENYIDDLQHCVESERLRKVFADEHIVHLQNRIKNLHHKRITLETRMS